MRISDKVVCVDDSPSRNTGHKWLERDKVYVIEGIDEQPYSDGSFGIYLVGVPRAFHQPTGRHLGWDPERFRLLADLQAVSAAAAARQQLSTTTK